MDPLFTIVTPSRDQGRFLRRTIDSVLGQSYPRVQYIVVDGESRDDSAAILRSYGGGFAWRSEPDRGQAHAINKGFAQAKGEILGYLNADDVLLPEALERVARFFREHPDCDMVYGDADFIDEQDRVTGAYGTAPYSFERLLEDCMVCQPAAFWRRSIAEKVGPFDERLHYAMDYDYWQRIDRAGGRIQYLPEKLACSRRHPQSKTSSARVAIHREIIDVCWKNAGRVHVNFFKGYWRSVIWRPIPTLHRALGWLHHKGYHLKRMF